MKIKNLFIPIMTAALTAAPLFSITSCNKEVYVELKSFEVHASEKTIKPGASTQLFISTKPSNATDQDVTWTITGWTGTDEEKPTIEAGKLTAKNGEGDVTVTATSTKYSTITNTYKVTILNSAVESESLTEYIYDRSFSIATKAIWEEQGKYYTSWTAGTAWILADATPTIYEDYKYYIATNWHVKTGVDSFETQYKENNHILFGTGKTEADLNIWDGTGYYEINKQNLVWADSSKFTYGNESENGGGKRTPAIDAYVAEIDFGEPVNEVKDKLDKLNSIQQSKGYINKVAKPTNDEFAPLAYEMSVSGFPAMDPDDEKKKPVWQEHIINPFSSDDKMVYYPKGQITHTDKLPNNIMDIAPQFKMVSTAHDRKYMPGGASGSMLVGRLDGEILIYGIYWGGFYNSKQNSWQPCFSIFNSEEKNFFKDWIEYKEI